MIKGCLEQNDVRDFLVVTQAPVKPASGSSVSEIQPVSEFQPVSDIEPVTAEGTQTTSAGSDRHSAIRHAAAEVRGRPSATVPETRHTERTLSGRVIDRVSPIQQSSTGQAPVNERVQNVPGWTPTSDISTSQGTSDPNLRSGSGVPSEDEVAQLYSNGRTSIDVSSTPATHVAVTSYVTLHYSKFVNGVKQDSRFCCCALCQYFSIAILQQFQQLAKFVKLQSFAQAASFCRQLGLLVQPPSIVVRVRGHCLRT